MREDVTVDPRRFNPVGDQWPGHWRDGAQPQPFPATPEDSALHRELLTVARNELDRVPERQRVVVTCGTSPAWNPGGMRIARHHRCQSTSAVTSGPCRDTAGAGELPDGNTMTTAAMDCDQFVELVTASHGRRPSRPARARVPIPPHRVRGLRALIWRSSGTTAQLLGDLRKAWTPRSVTACSPPSETGSDIHMEHFDIAIIGTGSGNSIPDEAVCRQTDRDLRAGQLRRNMSERRLHPDENFRLCRGGGQDRP